MKQIIGPRQSHFCRYRHSFNDPAVDQAGWEAAAASAGLLPLQLDYAEEPHLSPGRQLFILASALFSLGLYAEVGEPGVNAAVWKERIIA